MAKKLTLSKAMALAKKAIPVKVKKFKYVAPKIKKVTKRK